MGSNGYCVMKHWVYSCLTISFLFSIILFLTGCATLNSRFLLNPTQTSIETNDEIIEQSPTVTIWIHGTKLTPSAVLPNFFYRKVGMHPIITYDSKYHLRKLAHCLEQSDQTNFMLEHFYVFGWSGKLSFTERKKAAQDLYDELINLCNHYKLKYGTMPKFRIITHSHGGNVALNLAQIKKDDFIKVSELILLACPVQTQTMHLLQDPIFEQVYSFYSETDIIQIIDPQGLYKNKAPKTSLFSKREFPEHNKLVQIKTRARKRGLMHIEFLSLPFISHLPLALGKIKDEKNIHCGSFILQLHPKRNAPTQTGVNDFQLSAQQQQLSHQNQYQPS